MQPVRVRKVLERRIQRDEPDADAVADRRFLSIKRLGENRVRLRVDFTGDFRHEIGLLELLVNEAGLIARIDANLESHTKKAAQWVR